MVHVWHICMCWVGVRHDVVGLLFVCLGYPRQTWFLVEYGLYTTDDCRCFFYNCCAIITFNFLITVTLDIIAIHK